MSRFFTIENMYRGNSHLRFSGGRYHSETPAGAAKKAFSQFYRHYKPTGRVSIVVHMRETTQESAKKIYKYRVTRVVDPVEFELNGETVIRNYTTTVKAL